MHKKIIFAVLSLGIILVGLAWTYFLGPVSFVDPNLELAVRHELGKPQGRISRHEVAGITQLHARGWDIQYLDGIQHLRNLELLDLEDNFIKDVTPLGKLRRLETLSLRNNEITSLEDINFGSLIGLPLRDLSLRHNVLRPPEGGQYRLSDISLLSHFTKLERLELRDNHIHNITPLAALTDLVILDISQNPLDPATLLPLKNMTGLVELNLRETYVTDLEPLKNFPGLRYLNIHSNDGIESLEPVSYLKELETLIMRDVPLGHELELLTDLENLMRLNIRNTSTDSIAPLRMLMEKGALQGPQSHLDIRDNPQVDVEDLHPFIENIYIFDHN